MLWSSGHINHRQRHTAERFAIMLLQGSMGTSEIRRIMALPRPERVWEWRRAIGAKSVLRMFNAQTQKAEGRKSSAWTFKPLEDGLPKRDKRQLVRSLTRSLLEAAAPAASETLRGSSEPSHGNGLSNHQQTALPSAPSPQEPSPQEPSPPEPSPLELSPQELSQLEPSQVERSSKAPSFQAQPQTETPFQAPLKAPSGVLSQAPSQVPPSPAPSQARVTPPSEVEASSEAPLSAEPEVTGHPEPSSQHESDVASAIVASPSVTPPRPETPAQTLSVSQKNMGMPRSTGGTSPGRELSTGVEPDGSRRTPAQPPQETAHDLRPGARDPRRDHPTAISPTEAKIRVPVAVIAEASTSSSSLALASQAPVAQPEVALRAAARGAPIGSPTQRYGSMKPARHSGCLPCSPARHSDSLRHSSKPLSPLVPHTLAATSVLAEDDFLSRLRCAEARDATSAASMASWKQELNLLRRQVQSAIVQDDQHALAVAEARISLLERSGPFAASEQQASAMQIRPHEQAIHRECRGCSVCGFCLPSLHVEPPTDVAAAIKYGAPVRF